MYVDLDVPQVGYDVRGEATSDDGGFLWPVNGSGCGSRHCSSWALSISMTYSIKNNWKRSQRVYTEKYPDDI